MTKFSSPSLGNKDLGAEAGAEMEEVETGLGEARVTGLGIVPGTGLEEETGGGDKMMALETGLEEETVGGVKKEQFPSEIKETRPQLQVGKLIMMIKCLSLLT